VAEAIAPDARRRER